MSSSGSEVVVVGRLGVPDLQRFRSLLPEATIRAGRATVLQLEPYLKNPAIVPRLTGRLQDSVVSFVSPGQIVFRWSAIDPDTGFNYAKIRDELGGRTAPPDYSGFILRKAKELLIQNLVLELRMAAS